MYNPPDPEQFHPVVWTVVRQVPHGVVSTYGQVASIIPPPKPVDAADYKRLGPKWVGQALNAISFSDVDGKPNQPGIPWWRIINGKGGISMPAGSRAAAEQRRRLETEGVVFGPDGTVKLGRYGWAGPSQAWLDEHGFIKPESLQKPDDPQQLSLF